MAEIEEINLSDNPEFNLEQLNTASIERFLVTVSSKSGWQNTGISLSKGERLNIQYVSGQWNGDGGRFPFHGPAGPIHDAYTAPSHYPLPGEVEDCMVGKVGNHKFKVGETLRMIISAPGTLALTINDVGYHDNSGSIAMRISVERR